jgi:extracellular elastinolytic metalloproteinase
MKSPCFFALIIGLATAPKPSDAYEIPNVVPSAAGSFDHHTWGIDDSMPALDNGGMVAMADSMQEENFNELKNLVCSFVADSTDEFRITAAYKTAHNGVTHIFTQQMVDEIPVMNGVGQVSFDKNGNMVSSSSSFWEGAAPVSPESLMDEHACMSKFADMLGDGESVDVSNEPVAEKMYVIHDGALVMSYVFEMILSDFDHVLDVALDATSGMMLQCVDLVSDAGSHVHMSTLEEDVDVTYFDFESIADDGAARQLQAGEGALYRGWDIPNITPELGPSVLVENPESRAPEASPLGWHAISDTVQFQDTRGNNVFAQENQRNEGGLPPPNGYRPSSQVADGLVFDFPMDFTRDPGEEGNIDAVITNLFMMNNILHDVLYTYGFDEASGNFQIENFGKGGNDRDPVVANSLDGSGVNNANMFTPPDGFAPRMRMYRWDRIGTVDRPSSLDGLVVAHEFMHGVSNRLTGGPANANCLSSLISGGMGEGWSDFVGVMMTIRDATDFAEPHAVGSWLVLEGGGGIRQFPYSTDMDVNPLTFGDSNSATFVHQVGTVWCTILFDMAANLVREFGFNTNIYQGTEIAEEGGNNVALQNVLDGMKLQPCVPDFIDARDAILLADQINYEGLHRCIIWESFARRGLGVNASYVGGGSIAVESFCGPEECTPGCSDDPLPTCNGDRDDWDAGHGGCSTYNEDGFNAMFCGSDCDENNVCAMDVCAECGVCVAPDGEEYPDVLPTPQPTHVAVEAADGLLLPPYEALRGRRVDVPILVCNDIESITFSMCTPDASCVDDTHLILLDETRNMVTLNDDSCGICAEVTFEPNISNEIIHGDECSTFILSQGCFSTTTCSGQVEVSVSLRPTGNPTLVPTVNTVTPTAVPTVSPTLLPTRPPTSISSGCNAACNDAECLASCFSCAIACSDNPTCLATCYPSQPSTETSVEGSPPSSISDNDGTTSDDEEDSDDTIIHAPTAPSTSLNSGTIAGATIGAVAGIGLLAFAVAVAVRRQNRATSGSLERNGYILDSTPRSNANTNTNPAIDHVV